jgi:hypothetical protein
MIDFHTVGNVLHSISHSAGHLHIPNCAAHAIDGLSHYLQGLHDSVHHNGIRDHFIDYSKATAKVARDWTEENPWGAYLRSEVQKRIPKPTVISQAAAKSRKVSSQSTVSAALTLTGITLDQIV